MKRLIGFGLSLAIVAVAGATAVEANCIPSQTVGTNGFLIWYNGSPFPTDVNEFVGNFWATGNKGGDGDGSNLPLSNWLYYFGGYPGWFYLRANLGDARIPGCPLGQNMTVVLDNCRTNEAMIMTAPHLPQYGAPQWDFAYYAFGTYVYAYADSSPRPRIVSSARDGNNINVTFSVPTQNNTVFDNTATGGMTALAVYRQASATTPDINTTAGWTLVTSGTPAAGVGATLTTVDCSDTTVDQWLATGVTVGGDIQLTCPVRVECDPTLADPGGPGPGLKKIKRPRGNPQRER